LQGKKKNREKIKLIKALVDSGASESILVRTAAKRLPLRQSNELKKWSTAAGMLDTKDKTKKVEFSLPELHANRTIKKSFHIVDLKLNRYDMIIGRDLITSLGLDVKGSDQSIKWDDAAIPWRDMESTQADAYFADDRHANQPVEQEIQRMTDILDAKYSKADLRKIVEEATHLNEKEREQLYKTSKKMKTYSTERSVLSPANRTTSN
jgi:hypothetical protein